MKFSEIEGHGREIGILRRAVVSGRVAHAYIFSGPDGVGKRLTARAFASVLNCDSPVTIEGGPEGGGGPEACGECRSCESMDGGGHLNLALLEPTTAAAKGDDEAGGKAPKKGRSKSSPSSSGGGGKASIKIEQIRDLQRRFRFAVESGRRVAIVDSAETLAPAAANAFLKTLEEPPEGTVIILITSRPAELLPTVISRCQRISFGPLPVEVVARKVMDASEGDIDGAAAERAASFSGGSISAAMALVEGDEIERRHSFVERLISVDPHDGSELLVAAKDLAGEENLDAFLEYMKASYRSVAVDEACGDRSGGGDGAADAIRCFDLVEEARRSVAPPRNGNKLLTMEVLLMDLLGSS